MIINSCTLTNTMKKLTLFAFAISMVLMNTGMVLSQETKDSLVSDKDKRPVRGMFENGVIMNSQTPVNLKKKSLEYMIQHRFGNLENGSQDLWGIFGAANIRFGLNYGITDRIQAGIGVTKNNTLLDLNGKFALLRQTRSGSVPLSVTYYPEIGYTFKDDTARYKETSHRISYFHQLILGRKFNDKLSLQISGSFAHFNIVDSTQGTQHNNLGIGFAGRYKVSPQSSVMVEYIHPLTKAEKEIGEAKPDLSIGWEIATSSHAFHIFIGSSKELLGGHNLVYNQFDYTKPKEGLLIGFNITRNWDF
jgi:hypothetical protein